MAQPVPKKLRAPKMKTTGHANVFGINVGHAQKSIRGVIAIGKKPRPPKF